ncbi:MAG: AraC family transcriptional regulator ligand-binding domain-containing protein [Trueperaceae bacterium]|nr:AraC family transcriptional regulator ligand-binding domain-containing protein [Trueperaceae bacterium]
MALRACLSAFTALGLDDDRIRREAGIDAAALADPDARIPLSATARIWPAAQVQWAKPGLGLHAGEALPEGAQGLLEYVFASADTVRAGLAAIAHAFPVVSGGHTTLVYDLDAGALCYGGSIPEQVRDYALTGLARMTGRYGARPIRAELAGPPFDAPARYVNALGCDVHFDAPRNRLAYAGDVLDQPLPGRYRGLQPLLRREVARLRSGMDRDFVDVVRAEIATHLPGGTPRLADVAARLAMGTRTLQRRLHRRGWAFRSLTEDVRRERGIHHVAEARLAVGEIAYLLGYADPPSFTRAYTRWTGAPPSRARRRAPT